MHDQIALTPVPGCSRAFLQPRNRRYHPVAVVEGADVDLIDDRVLYQSTSGLGANCFLRTISVAPESRAIRKFI